MLYTAAAPAFGPSNTNGLVTQVVLKIVNGTEASKSTAAASGGEITSNPSYSIVQVGSEPSLSSSTNGQDSLHAEIPLDSLGSLSYSYKYCYPNGSKLQSQQTSSQTSGSTNGNNNCTLKSWGSASNSGSSGTNGASPEVLKYLLETIAKFIQLQHQINLLSIIKPAASSGSSGGGTQLPERCKTVNLQQVSNQQNGQNNSQLASLFSPLTPKNCLISPSSATVTLNMNSPQAPAAATAAASQGSSSITLENVKKATLSGTLAYQAFDYWGKKLSNGSEGTNGCCQISHQNISFQLEGSTTNGSSGSTGTGTTGTPTSVKLADLWEKYLKRELKIEDWCKQASSKK